MKLRCPHCGHSAGLTDFANEEAARKAILLAADLPKSIGYLTLRYVGLFRPSQRSLSWERTLKIMQQLKVDIDRAKIERHSRIWHAPEALWHEGLTVMLARADSGDLRLPLKNHAYLYEIISAKQNSAEARQEQQLEQKRQQLQHRVKKPQTYQPSQADKTAGEQAMQQAFNCIKVKRQRGGKNEQ